MGTLSTRTRALLGSGALLLAGGAAIAIASPNAPTITGGPTGLTNDRSPFFTWSAGGGDGVATFPGIGVFTWTLNGNPVGSGSATQASLSGLADGDYTFGVSEENDPADPVSATPSPQATRSFTVDGTPPVVTAANNAGQWFRAGDTVTWSCTDAHPGSCPGPTTPSGEGDDVLVNSGQSVDGAGNTASGSTTIKRDTSAPTVSITSPPAGHTIELGPGNSLTFEFACADAVSGVATCTGSPVGAGGALDVGQPGTGADTLGPRTVTVLATDVAGNSVQTPPRTYNVVDTRAPDPPALGQPRDVTKDVRPTFSWAPVTDNGTAIAQYDLVVDGQEPIAVKGPPGAAGEYAVTWPANRQALSIANHSWRVRAVDAAGNVGSYSDTVAFTVDPNAPNPPTITAGPRGFTRITAPTFAFTGLVGTTFTWKLFRANGNTPLQQGSDGSGQAALSSLSDGQYRFDVSQVRPDTGADSPAASALFTVDTVAPSVPRISGSPGTTGNQQPQFAWTGTEAGANFRWIVTGAGGETRLGPGTTTSTSLTLPAPLPGGAYVFRVKQVDQAGNESDWSAPEPFTVVAAPASPPPSGPVTTSRPPGTRVVPTTRNARLLTPRAGTKVTTLRPLLKWKRRAGATLYNVQIYRVSSTRSVKVLSVFPRGTSYRVKVGKLKRGERYVWRVWPYLGGLRRYTGAPLGMSWFDVSARAVDPSAPRAGQVCSRAQRGKATKARNGRTVRCVVTGRTQRWRYR